MNLRKEHFSTDFPFYQVYTKNTISSIISPKRPASISRMYKTYQKIVLQLIDVIFSRWIGSFQLFLMFGLSAVTGKLHDEGYTRHLIIIGSIIYAVCVQMVSLAHEYYSIFLAQGLGMGLGIGKFSLMP